MDAKTEKEATHHLEKLLESDVRPIIVGILKHKLHVLIPLPENAKGLQSPEEADGAELFQDILVQVTAALHRRRTNRETPPISNLSDFVAAIGYQVINLYFRKRYPKRTSLSNKLRFLLNSRPEFCRWQADNGEWLAGYRSWQEQNWESVGWNCRNSVVRFQLENSISDADVRTPAKLVARIFDWLGHPIRFHDLVAMLAEIWEVRDLPTQSLSPEEETAPLLREQFSFTEEIHTRVTLRRYWMALRVLPPNQRCCLLLQASDPVGNSLIHILHAGGIASLAELAEAVAMPLETLKAIYQELPWEDKTIAVRLHTTPQYAIRLRGVARKRLAQAIQSEEDRGSDG